jgi:hypothetical protein
MVTPAKGACPFGLRLGARLRLGRAGLADLGWWWSAAGCPVGDQPRDGQVGLGVVLPPPDPALQRPPLLLSALACSTQIRWEDCCLRACCQASSSSGGAFLAGWSAARGPDQKTPWPDPGSRHRPWRGRRRIAAAAPRSLGLDRRLVVHPTWPHRPRPQRPTAAVADGGDLDGVLLLLARDKRPPPSMVRPWPADLGLGPVKAQLDAFGRGVGHHVGQGLKAHARPAWDGEAAPDQQGSDLMDGTGDGGAVRPVQHPRAWWGSWKRRITRVARTRSVKTNWWWGPAPAARWRRWPRRWCRAPWWAAVHGSANSAISSPRCCRDRPVKTGWERAARAHVGVDTHTRSPVRSVSRAPGDPGHDHPRPHVAELRGAIVHSGCFNRTLTPRGSSTNGEATGPFPMSTTRSAAAVRGPPGPPGPDRPRNRRHQPADPARAGRGPVPGDRRHRRPRPPGPPSPRRPAFLFQESHQALVREHA